MPNPARPKSALSGALDLPLLLAAVQTAAFYWVMSLPAMKGSLLWRYTTEHVVEYVIVALFIWGVTDALLRALGFPRELLALREDWLPARTGQEPVSHAAVLLAGIEQKPEWQRDSRLGQRLHIALTYLAEKGSAAEFREYLDGLSIQDDDRTHRNYGLIRFIAWVMPVLGFLGTVLHFGSALGGFTGDEIASKLDVVVTEMGSAFNTTASALVGATTMMFSLFLCERTEHSIISSVDRRTEAELLTRFEVADPSLTPFISAIESATRARLEAMDAAIERQLGSWSTALGTFVQRVDEREGRQVELWSGALQNLQRRFDAGETEREGRLRRLLDTLEAGREEHRTQLRATAEHFTALRGDFAQLAQAFSSIAEDEGKLVGLQSTLTENLRLLRETQQIDQALHGLAAAIHLLTARQNPAAAKENRAA